jgi:hypothetical protein
VFIVTPGDDRRIVAPEDNRLIVTLGDERHIVTLGDERHIVTLGLDPRVSRNAALSAAQTVLPPSSPKNWTYLITRLVVEHVQAKCPAFCCFLAVVVQKLRFLNNSITL